MDYQNLTEADRYRMVKGKILGYEQQHFEATLNLAAAEAAGETRAADGFHATLVQCEAAIDALRPILTELPVPEDREVVVGEAARRRALRET